MCGCTAGVPGSAMGGNLVLAGRAKDTIVLSSGENIEPATLEDLITASPVRRARCGRRAGPPRAGRSHCARRGRV